MSFSRLCFALFVSASLVACGGSSSGTAEPPPGPAPTNRTPTAGIAPTSTVTAGAPLSFDASGSSDADGDALNYDWDFGDGERGGGVRLSHLFATAGRYTVTLSVGDGRGGNASATRVVDVSAAPAATRTQVVSVRVAAVDGTALAGVSVAALSATALSDAQGVASLTLGIGAPQTLRLSRAGLADQVLSVTLADSSGADTRIDATMRPRDAALTLADAAAGGTLDGRDGARIELPANALRTTAGAAVTGAVQIAMTPVDITQPRGGGFPGRFAGVDAAGTQAPLLSFGTTEFVLSQAGARLQLAPGARAQILLPLYATRTPDGAVLSAGQRVPLWSLDERTGVWVQEGEGEVVISAAAPTGLALRGTVAHFSWWNADRLMNERIPKVRKRCVYDDDIGIPESRAHFQTATLCNWLAEMDRGIPPQGATGAVRAKAEVAPLAGFAASDAIPVGGDDPQLPLPANTPIRFTVTAHNGAFTGSATLLANSTANEIVVKMRPLTSGGGDAERVTLPFEGARSFATGQTRSFGFNGVAFRWLRVTVTSTGSGVPMSGEIRLFRGSAGLASAQLSASPYEVLLPAAADDYRVELVPSANTPNTASIRLEQIGSITSEAHALPYFSGERILPAFTALATAFDAPAARTLYVTSRSGPAQLRVRDAAGSESFNAPTGSAGSSPPVEEQHIALPAAGRYTLDTAALGEDPLTLQLAAELSQWQPLGAKVSGYNLIDLVADRTGRPVLLLSRRYLEAGVERYALAAQRWTGSAWQAAAPELTGLLPRNGCGTPLAAGLVFDGENRALIASVEESSIFRIRVRVRRLEGNAWQALGANDGQLYEGNAPTPGCFAERAQLRIDGQGRPVAAFTQISRVQVSRFEAGAWTGLVNTAAIGDLFDGNMFDIQIDATGRPLVVFGTRSSAGTVLARRYEPSPAAWLALGSDNGLVPQPAGQSGGYIPLLRFDATGQPIIASGNGITAAVSRYDGTRWATGAAYRHDNQTAVLSMDGFAFFSGNAFLAWVNQEGLGGSSPTRPVVHTVDAADRYTPIGDYQGAVPPFHPHALTQRNGRQQRLLVIDGVLYQAIEAYSSNAGAALGEVTLLRYGP